MRTFFKNGMWKEIIAALLVSVMIGTAFVYGLTFLANGFLNNTVSSLVGETDSYDIIAHIKLDMAKEASAWLDSLAGIYPDLAYKESVSLMGKANIFISVGSDVSSDRMKGFLEALPGIPGYGGATIISEPRIVVSGIADKTYELVKEDVESISGVKYAFKFGNDMNIICESPDKMPGIETELESIVNEYTVVDVRYSIKDDDINEAQDAMSIQNAYKNDITEVWDISINKDNPIDPGAVTEIERLFKTWSTKIEVVDSDRLRNGDVLYMCNEDDAQKLNGLKIKDDDVLIEVETGTDGSVSGKVIQGETSELIKSKYTQQTSENSEETIDTNDTSKFSFALLRVENNVIKDIAGKALVDNPRVSAKLAVEKASELANGVAQSALGVKSSVDTSVEIVNAYEHAMDSFVELQRTLENVGILGDSAISADKIASLQRILETVSDSLDKFKGLLKKTSFFTSVYDVFINDIGAWQNKLSSLYSKVAVLSSDSRNSSDLTGMIADIQDFTNSTMSKMNSLDVSKMKEELDSMKEEFGKIASDSTKSVAGDLENMKESLPSLKDYEIADVLSSIAALGSSKADVDQPRATYLIKGSGNYDNFEKSVKDAIGPDAEGVYRLSSGIVQTGVRGEVDRLLYNVKTMISGILTLIFALFILLFDHVQLSAFVSYFKAGKRSRASGLVYQVAIGFVLCTGLSYITNSSIGSLYGAGMGLLGAVIGFVTHLLSKNFSKIDQDEVDACYAFGIKERDILREVIIPEGKSGILKMLNKRLTRSHLLKEERSLS